MKKYSYGKLIGMSWGWLKEMLFRPSKLKKWIMLYIIIFLAGYMGGGGVNFNLGADRAGLDNIINELRQGAPVAGEIHLPSTAPAFPEIIGQPKIPPIPTEISSFFKNPQLVTPVAIIALFILLVVSIFILLWMWVGSNFSFVFIDSVIRNDASLRIPFHRNKTQGNSYFRWNVAFMTISSLLFAAIIALPVAQLIKAGVFSGNAPLNAGEILSIVLGYAPIFILYGILFFLIAFFTREFVLPIMYKKKITVLKGWKLFIGLFKGNIGEILKYLIVRLLLSILSLAVMVTLVIVGIIALLLIGGVIGLLGWLIYSVTPAAAKAVSLIVLIIAGIPIFLYFIILFNVLFILIPIFFRTFSINVLGSMDESLDLFAAKTPDELVAEGSDKQYIKSMRLVWFTVLFPLLMVLIAILLAIAIPNFISAREQGAKMQQPGIKDIMQFKKSQMTAPGSPSKRDIMAGRVVTVYLKNGNSFEAAIENETERNIAFRIEGGSFVLPRSDILRIERKKESE